MASQRVKVYIYDISKGMARAMSQALIGRQLDGVWHTGIVVFGKEYFFGGDGISCCNPGGTILGAPDQTKDLGETQIPYDVFRDYLQDLSQTSFRPECYHLMDHNCNNFSDELAQFLTGQGIPEHITNLPNEVRQTPIGAMIENMMSSMQVTPQGGQQLFPSQPTFSPQSNPRPSVPASQPPHVASKPAQQHQDLSEHVFYKDLQNTFSRWRGDVEGVMPSDQVPVLQEVVDYVHSARPVSWSLGRTHLMLLSNLITNKELSVKTRSEVACLLQGAFLQENVSQMASHDPDQTMVKLIGQHETIEPQVLAPVIRALCNCFTNQTGAGWLTGSMEGQSLCPLVIKSCVHCLLNTDAVLRSLGAALAFNVTLHKIDEEHYMELGGALLQLLTAGETREDTGTAKNSLAALHQCVIADNEVAALARVMELDLSIYQEDSLKHVSEELSSKLSL